jgi:hypothetical protein
VVAGQASPVKEVRLGHDEFRPSPQGADYFNANGAQSQREHQLIDRAAVERTDEHRFHKRAKPGTAENSYQDTDQEEPV